MEALHLIATSRVCSPEKPMNIPPQHATSATAAHRVLDIANAIGPDAQGRIFVERITAVFLNGGGEAYEYRAGMARLKRDGLIDMHESGTFFRLVGVGA